MNRKYFSQKLNAQFSQRKCMRFVTLCQWLWQHSTIFLVHSKMDFSHLFGNCWPLDSRNYLNELIMYKMHRWTFWYWILYAVHIWWTANGNLNNSFGNIFCSKAIPLELLNILDKFNPKLKCSTWWIST